MGKTLTCCTQTWRWIFVTLNILFTIIGMALIGVGIWLIVRGTDYSFITDSLYASPASLLIVAGVITVVIAVIGIIGALGMWFCVLIVYISILALVIVLEITAGILGAVFSSRLGDVVEERVRDAIEEYSNTNSSTDVNDFVDFIQNEFQCCGYTGPQDWLNTTYLNSTDGTLPESCECDEDNDVIDNSTCGFFNQLNQDTWLRGCNESVTDEIRNNLGIVAGVGVAFGLFQLTGIAISLALCICACMQRKKEDDFPVDEYVY